MAILTATSWKTNAEMIAAVAKAEAERDAAREVLNDARCLLDDWLCWYDGRETLAPSPRTREVIEALLRWEITEES